MIHSRYVITYKIVIMILVELITQQKHKIY